MEMSCGLGKHGLTLTSLNLIVALVTVVLLLFLAPEQTSAVKVKMSMGTTTSAPNSNRGQRRRRTLWNEEPYWNSDIDSELEKWEKQNKNKRNQIQNQNNNNNNKSSPAVQDQIALPAYGPPSPPSTPFVVPWLRPHPPPPAAPYHGNQNSNVWLAIGLGTGIPIFVVFSVVALFCGAQLCHDRNRRREQKKLLLGQNQKQVRNKLMLGEEGDGQLEISTEGEGEGEGWGEGGMDIKSTIAEVELERWDTLNQINVNQEQQVQDQQAQEETKSRQVNFLKRLPFKKVFKAFVPGVYKQMLSDEHETTSAENVTLKQQAQQQNQNQVKVKVTGAAYRGVQSSVCCVEQESTSSSLSVPGQSQKDIEEQNQQIQVQKQNADQHLAVEDNDDESGYVDFDGALIKPIESESELEQDQEVKEQEYKWYVDFDVSQLMQNQSINFQVDDHDKYKYNENVEYVEYVEHEQQNQIENQTTGLDELGSVDLDDEDNHSNDNNDVENESDDQDLGYVEFDATQAQLQVNRINIKGDGKYIDFVASP